MTDAEHFFDRLRHALASGTALRVSLSKPAPGGRFGEKLSYRPVTLSGALKWQESRREGPQEVHENLTPDELTERIETRLPQDFRNGHLMTSEEDVEIRFRGGGKTRLRVGKPSLSADARPAGTHDRQKQYAIPEGTPCRFLEEIGVMTPAGQVRNSRQKKFRQINHYLDVVSGVLGHLPDVDVLKVVDFGCGKSYLTFALHHYLTEVKGRAVEIVGLDLKRDVIRDCNRVATSLGCEGLTFQVGDIAGYQPAGDVHLCVSLHACDTATDAALAQAVSWSTDVVLAAPCCQHEVAGRLDNRELSLLTAHGILKERFAALATDALRARVLELVGYSTKVVEFIDLEHTPKNVLIRAVRRDRFRSRAEQEKWTQRYEEFKALLGIETFALEEMLTAAGFWGELESDEEE